jgi:rhodanese-related sulfurtransferase
MRTYFTLAAFFLLFAVFGQTGAKSDTIYRNLNAIQADSLITAYDTNSNFVIIDVRTPADFNTSHIENAININYYDANFSSQISALDHSKAYLLYCQGGSRSGATFTMMQGMHFKEVYNLLGGINSWISNGFPVVSPTGLEDQASLEQAEVLVYPNPATTWIQLEFQGRPDYVRIVDPSGRLIWEKKDRIQACQLDISTWGTGLFLIETRIDSHVQTSILVVR